MYVCVCVGYYKHSSPMKVPKCTLQTFQKFPYFNWNFIQG